MAGCDGMADERGPGQEEAQADAAECSAKRWNTREPPVLRSIAR